jgi:hypothetical protein
MIVVTRRGRPTSFIKMKREIEIHTVLTSLKLVFVSPTPLESPEESALRLDKFRYLGQNQAAFAAIPAGR